MRTLLEEVIGAIAMPKVIELPRLRRINTCTHGVLVDQDFDGAEIPGEVTRIGIRLGGLQWSDLRIVLSRGR